MFCVSDTRNKMKKCPKVTGEAYGVNREWCVCWGRRARVRLPFFLPVCIFLFLFCFAFPVLVGDVYLVLMLHWKAVWLPTWLLENWVLGIFWHVFVASDTDSFMANIVFSRAWLPHLWESILDPRENRTFAYISQQSWSAPLLGFSSKRTFCDVVIPLCHSWFYELWRNWALEWFLWGIPKTESLIF